jgi:hypothetical protein
MITFETSWLERETRESLRALLTHRRFTRDPDLVRTWGGGDSGIDLFFEAGVGEAVWLCVVDLSELLELESLRLGSASPPEFSLVEVCRRKYRHVAKN